MKPSQEPPPRLVSTAAIVAAYITRNPVLAEAIPAVITTVYGALAELDRLPPERTPETPTSGPRLVSVSPGLRRAKSIRASRSVGARLRIVGTGA